MVRDDDEMFMTGSFNVTPQTIERHLIICSDKSAAYVTNNRRLPSTYCAMKLKLKLTTDRHEASCGYCGFFATAELLVNSCAVVLNLMTNTINFIII